MTAIEYIVDGLPVWLKPGDGLALGSVYRSEVYGFAASVGGQQVPCGRPSFPRTSPDDPDPAPPYLLEQVAAEARAILHERGFRITRGAGDAPPHECPL